MVLFLMSIKFKDTDYLQKKQFTFKNESSEESKKKKERELLSKFPLSYRGAVGETRTRTGLLPLPPQSSVSTISPPPLCFGIAKIRTKIKSPNFFEKFYTFF